MESLGILLLFVAIFGVVRPECSNGCSGHGICTQWDMCTCFRNFQGNDCSERICQFARAWADSPKGDLDSSGTIDGPEEEVAVNSAAYPYGTSESYPMMRDSDLNIVANSGHEYAECSAVGICNRKTGLCECQPGYEGVACHRLSCPDYGSSDGTISSTYYSGQCSGHGVCQTLKRLARKEHNTKYMQWDHSQSTACKCDPGYFGPDCHQRHCKKDLDPQYLDDVTTIGFGRYYLPVLASDPNAVFTNGEPLGKAYFTVKYYDYFDQPYQSAPIYYNATCEEVVAALEAIPNKVIPANSVACQILNVFNLSALEDRPAWKYSFYSRYTAYIDGLRTNTLSVHPVFWLQGHTSSLDKNATDDPTLTGYIYRLEFLGNYGELREPEVNLLSDGPRPTLQVDRGHAFTNIWSDGQRVEGINFWANHCHDVTVGIKKAYDGVWHLTGFGWGEKNRLKKCLGSADYDDSNNGDSSNADWDHGSEEFPHVIRLVKTVTDVTDSGYFVPIVYDTTLTGYDDHGEDLIALRAKGADSDGTAGTFRLLIPFEGIDHIDYGSPTTNNVEWEVYTTSGTVQRAGNLSEVSFDFASKVIYAANVTKGTETSGNIACNDIGATSGFVTNTSWGACMNKGDYFFLLDPYTRDYNPPYINLYRADAVLTSDETPRGSRNSSRRYNYEDQTPSSIDALFRYKTHMIISDIATNWAQEVDGHAIFHMYKFTPNYDVGTYEYMAECSNRGVCNHFEGLCECFLGYEGDACSVHGGVQL